MPITRQVKHRRQQNIAAGILGFFGQRGDAVEADIGQHGDRRAAQHGFHVEHLRIVKRPGEETGAVVRMPEDVARRGDKEDRDDDAHAGGQRGIQARRGLDSLNVQDGEHAGKEDRPDPVGHAGSKHVRLLADPDDADHRIEHVVHHHAPSGDVAERGIDLLTDIGECRAGAGIGARHASVADGGEQHARPSRSGWW